MRTQILESWEIFDDKSYLGFSLENNSFARK